MTLTRPTEELSREEKKKSSTNKSWSRNDPANFIFSPLLPNFDID